MKEYKGIYFNTKDTTKLYEFGAHFKYSELYEKLKKLQEERNEDILDENKYNSFQTENNIDEIELTKKRKKFKLKTHAEKDNNRYLNLKSILNEKKEDKKEKKIPTKDEEEEDDNNNEMIHHHKRKKKNKLMTYSLDKVRLPNINSRNVNNGVSLRNKLFNLNNNNKLTKSNVDIKEDLNKNDSPFKTLNKSINFKNTRNNFPKINSLYYNSIIEETETNQNIDEDIQPLFKYNSATKVNDLLNKKNNNIIIGNRNNPLGFFRSNFVTKNNEEDNVENEIKLSRKNERLKSIFEKEKQIKNHNNNLFL